MTGGAPSGLVTLAGVRSAARLIADTVVRTPLLAQPWAGGDRPLWLKPESLQPTGAFKLRGALNAIRSLGPEDRARGVIAHSSGNHAQAVAFAAALLGIRATIVMPDTAPAVKVDATRAYGAKIVLVSPAERDTVPYRLARQHGWVMIPPYDDVRIVEGQGTVGLEIAEDLPSVRSVLVPVSGGGLGSGVAVAVTALCPRARIVLVEPELAADAAESIRTGRRASWSPERTYRTIADGLRTTSLGELPWELLRTLADRVITVTEEEIAAAVRILAHRSRLVAEPSGAVATAGYLFHSEELPTGPAVAVVSGGNVDPDQFKALLAMPRSGGRSADDSIDKGADCLAADPGDR